MSLAAISATTDLLIVGAGPAGMAAAIDGAALGLSVLLVDENPAPGGQVYRAVSQSSVADPAVLGADYYAGKALVAAVEAAPVARLDGTTVWMVERNEVEAGVVVGLVQNGDFGDVARIVTAQSVLIAAGALERPFPISGWTLPGVMTAGAGQSLLKASGIVPEGPTVLAGTGPLLYLLAAQYARAGVAVAALLDTTPRKNWASALPHLPAFLASPYARKGLGLLAEVRRATRHIGGVTKLTARGDAALGEILFTAGGCERRIEAKTMFLHQGVVPQVNLAMAAGCEHRWHKERLAFEPVLDEWGESTVAGVFVAGDGAGVGGAKAAEASGRLSALGIAAQLGKLAAGTRDARAAPLRRALAQALRGRRFLDALYRPADQFRIPPDEVVVCRCEEVTAGAVRAVTARGAQGPNQTKTFLRTGMGPCQGRLCGLTVSEIMAHESGRPVEAVGHFRIRSPVKPITLGAFAALAAARTPGETKARRVF